MCKLCWLFEFTWNFSELSHHFAVWMWMWMKSQILPKRFCIWSQKLNEIEKKKFIRNEFFFVLTSFHDHCQLLLDVLLDDYLLHKAHRPEQIFYSRQFKMPNCSLLQTCNFFNFLYSRTAHIERFSISFQAFISFTFFYLVIFGH